MPYSTYSRFNTIEVNFNGINEDRDDLYLMYDRRDAEDTLIMTQGLGINLPKVNNSEHAVLKPGFIKGKKSGYNYNQERDLRSGVTRNWPYAFLFVGGLVFFINTN